jgi:hypothetical protein
VATIHIFCCLCCHFFCFNLRLSCHCCVVFLCAVAVTLVGRCEQLCLIAHENDWSVSLLFPCSQNNLALLWHVREEVKEKKCWICFDEVAMEYIKTPTRLLPGWSSLTSDSQTFGPMTSLSESTARSDSQMAETAALVAVLCQSGTAGRSNDRNGSVTSC